MKLGELSLSDMLDVIHFFFEDDILNPGTKEGLDAKEAVRVSLYRELYNKEYTYTSSSSSRFDPNLIDDELSHDDIPMPVDPYKESGSALPPKPFVPATHSNANSGRPFGSIVDAPLG